MDTSSFAALAAQVLDEWLAWNPDQGTELGDHRHDDRLPDRSTAGRSARSGWAAARLADLRAVDTSALDPEDAVDARILAARLRSERFSVEELRENEWNPLPANPGRAIHTLLAREFAPLPDRLSSLAGRLAEIPAVLSRARASLTAMPEAHLRAALDQFAGTIALVGSDLDRYVADTRGAGTVLARVEAVRPAALTALTDHHRWLASRLAESDRDGTFRDPRYGADRFTRAFGLELDTDTAPDQVLASAGQDLAAVSDEFTEVAARVSGRPASTPGLVDEVLAGLDADGPPLPDPVGFARAALAGQRAFTAERDLVTDPGGDIAVIAMPEFERGAATAYCDWPGPLETAPLPTFVAISTASASWSAARVAAYHRTFDRHLLHTLLSHEAVPGHALQMRHARRFAGSTPVRAAMWSLTFAEGWGSYAQRLMVDHGYPGAGDPDALRVRELQMRLRWIVQAMVAIETHTNGMTERAATEQFTRRAHLPSSTAAARWAAVLRSPIRSCAYYLGYREITSLATELRAAHPDWTHRHIHDAILGHGTPPPRALRTLLELDPSSTPNSP